jgi:NADH:ubiquinone oxidoreductase subunit 3 (subunit A)
MGGGQTLNKAQALGFAIISVAFLVGVSISIAHRSMLLAVVSFVLFITTTGIGFVYKAKLRRKAAENQHTRSDALEKR